MFLDEAQVHDTTLVDAIQRELAHLLQVSLIVVLADLDGGFDGDKTMHGYGSVIFIKTRHSAV